MNPHCECPLAAGYCERHRIEKSLREHELCKGLASSSPSHGKNYWLAWEAGKLGATSPSNPVLDPDGFNVPISPDYTPRSQVGVMALNGPGTELHEILKENGYEQKPGCNCGAMILKMNMWGADGCRKHRDEIIDSMFEEFKSRRPIVARLVKKAAREQASEWLDDAIKRWEEKKSSLTL